MAEHMTGETNVSIHTSFLIRCEDDPLPSSARTGDGILILVSIFPLVARVVVGETYDQGDDAQLSCKFLYVFDVVGRVVVCKTYDGSDDVRVSHWFRDEFKSLPG